MSSSVLFATAGTHHDRVTHCANNTVTQQQTNWTSILEGAGGTQEETSTDDTTNTAQRSMSKSAREKGCNAVNIPDHGDMPVLELPLELMVWEAWGNTILSLDNVGGLL